MSTRAVRFNKEEEQLIKEFLDKNPIFDFSSLTRLAVMQFIQSPKLKITPVKVTKGLRLERSEKERIQ